jgi:hypothetical protein
MRTPTQFVFAATILCLSAPSAHADVIAASNFPADQKSTNGWQEIALNSPPYNGYTNSAWGQSFVANSSGILTTVDTLLAAGFESPMPGSPPLVVSFHESVAGLPTVNHAAIQYTAAAFHSIVGTTDHRVTIDFSDFRIPIHAGSEYIVTYQSPFGVGGKSGSYAPYFVGLILGNPIPFGRVTTLARNGVDWERSPAPTPPFTVELATRVWVTPEPKSLHMLFGALAAFVNTPCRRRRSASVHSRA